MIDDDKIVKAASELCDYGSIHDSEYRIEGFKKCAKWMQEEFLKDLWHPASEMPDKNRTLIGHQETSWTYEKIFECFTFMDGKPFGVRY